MAIGTDPVPGTLLYLDTSAVLRATLESGTAPEIEQRIRSARVLVSSRLSLVESCRVLIRLRALGVAQEDRLADAERDIAAVWARCELWEITRRVCEMACDVAHGRVLRALDAIHLATFVLARRELEGLELVTVDERLLAAVAGHGDAGPQHPVALLRANYEIDVRHILPSIHLPTLILHRVGDNLIPIEAGRYLGRVARRDLRAVGVRDPVALVILAPRPEATRALRHGRPLSPRVSLTPRNSVQLAATSRDVDCLPTREEVVENVDDADD